MSRLVLLFLTAAVLAACSNADGPYGYGYAANERPSLAQLGKGSDEGAADSFRPIPLQQAWAP